MNLEFADNKPKIRKSLEGTLNYNREDRKVIEYYNFEGQEYPVIKHPVKTPPELEGIGTLGFDPERKVILMSEIPEKFRIPAYFNEVTCPSVLEKEGACAEAVKKEINFVSDANKEEYYNWRISFFDGVKRFCSRMAQNSTETSKAQWEQYEHEMQLCVNYLESVKPGN